MRHSYCKNFLFQNYYVPFAHKIMGRLHPSPYFEICWKETSAYKFSFAIFSEVDTKGETKLKKEWFMATITFTFACA